MTDDGRKFDETKREELRTKYQELDFNDLSKRNRFGLFSQPGSVAIGETNMTKKIIPERDEDGKIKLQPEQIQIKKVVKGRCEEIYFSRPPSYHCIGDLYKNPPEHQLRGEVKDGYKTIGGYDMPWKPAKAPNQPKDNTNYIVQYSYKAAYGHMQDRVPVDKNFRDEEGAVKTAPWNVKTRPLINGTIGTWKDVGFNKQVEHMPDDYENARKIAIKELQEHKSKLQEAPMRYRVKSQALFNSYKDVIGEEGLDLKHKEPVPEPKPQVQHDALFKMNSMPPASGYCCTLAPFPKYQENPPREKTRRIKVEGEPDGPPAFRMTHKYKSRPSTSVTTNHRNLRQSYPSIFKK